MARTFIRQDTQIRNSDVYDDTVAPTLANFETNPSEIETDLNNMRSMLSHLLDVQAGNWYDVINTPSALESGTQRGVSDLNTDLHAVEKKRILREVHSLVDVTVTASQNWEILGAGELPAQTTAAVGAVTTLGTVVAAHGGTFGTHSLTEVAGATAINPLNLMVIVDGATRDPILSSGRQIYGLLHGESGVTDGATITDTTTTRVQISFVRVNATGDDLEACPVADIATKTVNYCTRERVRLEDLNEYDFLAGAIVDVPAGSTVTRQVAYDNQGTTPVDLTTNATLDLEGAGLTWAIRDDLEANLFTIVEGSAGGTSQFNIHSAVDELDIDAVVTNFANGVTIDSGSASPVDVGVTDGHVETSAGNLHIQAAAEIFFDDVNQTGSTWAQTDGIKLSETTAEWDDFETAFGEVSLLKAITDAANPGNARLSKVYANVTVDANADTDVGGIAGGANLDAQLPDMSTGTFLSDYDTFLNGELLRPGADAAANNDYYPGTSLANGQLKFEFKVKANDVLCVIAYS
jgi:hypothetical protein